MGKGGSGCGGSVRAVRSKVVASARTFASSVVTSVSLSPTRTVLNVLRNRIEGSGRWVRIA